MRNPETKRPMITQEQRDRYNETRRLKRQMAARHRKAERLKALQQIVERQSYLNDSAESLEYYRTLHKTGEVDVWLGDEKRTFSSALACSKFFNLNITIIRRLVSGQYSTTNKHTKGQYYFCPRGYREWLDLQPLIVPDLQREMELYVNRLKKGFDT